MTHIIFVFEDVDKSTAVNQSAYYLYNRGRDILSDSTDAHFMIHVVNTAAQLKELGLKKDDNVAPLIFAKHGSVISKSAFAFMTEIATKITEADAKTTGFRIVNA